MNTWVIVPQAEIPLAHVVGITVSMIFFLIIGFCGLALWHVNRTMGGVLAFA